MMTRLATFGFASLLLAGFFTPAAKAGDFGFYLNIGGDRCYEPVYSRSYYYDDCYAPVVVAPRRAYYYDDCRPTYYRTARVYSTRGYYTPRYHRASVGHGGHHRGGRAYYRH